jgi:sugar-specific transcriptional regulator TrmB
LDTQAPDQEKGLIAEREGRIKLYVISNPTIILDHQISSIQRLTTMVNSPKITQTSIAEFQRIKPHASYGSAIYIDILDRVKEGSLDEV